MPDFEKEDYFNSVTSQAEMAETIISKDRVKVVKQQQNQFAGFSAKNTK